MTSVLIRLIRWLGHVKLVNRGLAVNLSFLLVPLWAGRGHHSYPRAAAALSTEDLRRLTANASSIPIPHHIGERLSRLAASPLSRGTGR
jgi:hypothetical protein